MMLRSLRARLVLSHVGLLFITIPLVGIALVYVLETRVLLVNVSRQLTAQAVLVAEMARDHPEVWAEQKAGQAFVDRVNPLFSAQLMLLSADGRVLASGDPADTSLVGKPLDSAGAAAGGVAAAAASGRYSLIQYSQNAQAEIADVMVRSLAPDGSVAGIVRVTDQYATVFDRFLQLRFLIAEVLGLGLLAGSVVGLLLAANVERPLRDVTRAIAALAVGHQLAPLPERQGPEETRVLSRAANTLVERLRELEDNRRLLLSGLIHELGRPLGALCAGVHALRTGACEDHALRDDLLAGIDGELMQMQRLVGDLAELRDKMLGALELHRQTVDLGEWLPGLLSPWAEAAGQKGLDWQVALVPDLPCLPVDPDRLGQAIGNLLSNAIKYTPEGGRVSVSARAEQGVLRLAVADTGPGIPAGEQERVFEPFYRSPAIGRFPKGMGLGLGIARDLVVAHGGRLSLDSAAGAGSRFTIDLPLQAQRLPGLPPHDPPTKL